MIIKSCSVIGKIMSKTQKILSFVQEPRIKAQESTVISLERTLDSCDIGFEGTIIRIKNIENNIHFLENGFTPHSSIKVLFKAPLGDPIAVQIRGTIIALRKEEASCIYV